MTYWFHALIKPQHLPLHANTSVDSESLRLSLRYLAEIEDQLIAEPTVSCSLDTFHLTINCIPAGKSVCYCLQSLQRLCFNKRLSFCRGGLHPVGVCIWGRGLHPGGLHWGGVGRILWDMVNEWVVSILLECILVCYCFCYWFHPGISTGYRQLSYRLYLFLNVGQISQTQSQLN